jgi:RimJ/RimL family protein N-acetyltransferase
MIDIRSATVADVPFLAAAQAPEHAHGFVLPASEAEICAALDRADRSTFVIEEDAMPAGMILLAYDPPSPWIVEFRRIIVTRPGLGIGFAAVRWVVGWSFEKLDAHRIW